MIFVMQARSSEGGLYAWLSDVPDFAAAGYPGPGDAEDVVVSKRILAPGEDPGAHAYAKDAVRVATAVALPANTRTGNVLEADANGALPSIDGVALELAERLLVKNEALGANNGLYVVTSLGSGGSKWQLTRAGDFDASAEVKAGAFGTIAEGASYADKFWILQTNDPIVLNTTALAFSVQTDQQSSVIRVRESLALSELSPATVIDGVMTADDDGVIHDSLDDAPVGSLVLLLNANAHAGVWRIVSVGAVDEPWELERPELYDGEADVLGNAFVIVLGTESPQAVWVNMTLGAFLPLADPGDEFEFGVSEISYLRISLPAPEFGALLRGNATGWEILVPTVRHDPPHGTAAGAGAAVRIQNGLPEFEHNPYWKAAVLAATTVALPACTYLDSNSIGDLIADADGALPAIDGLTLAVNERVLVKNQADASQNGVYYVIDVGDVSNEWQLRRDVDFFRTAHLGTGLRIPISKGSVNGGKIARLSSPDDQSELHLNEEVEANSAFEFTIDGGSGFNNLYYKDPVDYAFRSLFIADEQQAVSAVATYDVGDMTLTANADGFFVLGEEGSVIGRRLLVFQNGDINGIYTITDPGSETDPWVLTRASDFDDLSEIATGVIFRVLGNLDDEDLGNQLANTIATLMSQGAPEEPLGDGHALDFAFIPAPVENFFSWVNNPAKAMTTEPLPACTYDPGSRTLTADANGSLTVDGIAIGLPQRVVVKDQADATQNGIYICTEGGGVSDPWVLTRDSNGLFFDSGTTYITAGLLIRVLDGAFYAGALASTQMTDQAVELDVGDVEFVVYMNTTREAGTFSGQLETWNGSAWVKNTNGVAQLRNTGAALATPETTLANFQLHDGAEIRALNKEDWVANAGSENGWLVTYIMSDGVKREVHRACCIQIQTTDDTLTPIFTLAIPTNKNYRVSWTIQGTVDGGGHRAMRAGDTLLSRGSGAAEVAAEGAHALYRSDGTWLGGTGPVLASPNWSLNVQAKDGVTVNWLVFVGIHS